MEELDREQSIVNAEAIIERGFDWIEAEYHEVTARDLATRLLQYEATLAAKEAEVERKDAALREIRKLAERALSPADALVQLVSDIDAAAAYLSPEERAAYEGSQRSIIDARNHPLFSPTDQAQPRDDAGGTG